MLLSLTSSETRALLVASVLIILATVARATLLRSESEAWQSNLRAVPADSLIAQVRARLQEEARRAAPLRAGERIDPNRAAEDELDRLPGVGPALAREIVHAREVHGPFLWAEDLERVAGLGPTLLERIRDRVTLPPRPAGAGPVGGRAAAAAEPGPPLDLNRATADELTRIPGIGPKRAAQILAARQARGGFRSIDDLLEVPGIGPKTVARIRPFVHISP